MGADALREFAAGGGTLIFLNRATGYAISRLGVNARNVTENLSAKEFYSPGSLLNVKLDLRDPLTRGLPEDITIWSEGSPAWVLPDTRDETPVANCPGGNLLASGWLLGEKTIAGKTALIDAKSGRGRVILFGMRPNTARKAILTFKLFFNALTMN